MLGVGRNLDAERTADVVGDHPYSGLGDTERPGERREQMSDALRRSPDRVPTVSGFVLGNDAPCLQGSDDQAVVDDVESGDVGGSLECGGGGVRVAAFPVEGDVAGGGRPQRRRVRHQGGEAVDHHVELLVVDDDPLGGVRRGPAALRNDHRHGVAHVHRTVAGEQGARDVDGRLAGSSDHAVRLVEWRDAVRLQIASSEDRDDSRRPRRVPRVDGNDAGVRVRGAHDPRMYLVSPVDVVDESAAPGEQGGVFAPWHARADGGGECAGHVSVPSGIRR